MLMSLNDTTDNLSLFNGRVYRGELVAVHDGVGENATWGLYAETEDQETEEIPWPDFWPDRVSTAFLKAQGFRIEQA
jgi:hypothetical protein